MIEESLNIDRECEISVEFEDVIGFWPTIYRAETERRLDIGIADYVLYKRSEKNVIAEVKMSKPRNNLFKALGQCIMYSRETGFHPMVVTDSIDKEFEKAFNENGISYLCIFKNYIYLDGIYVDRSHIFDYEGDMVRNCTSKFMHKKATDINDDELWQRYIKRRV